jgi:drug/metabolite transporter (DMT)-like permease
MRAKTFSFTNPWMQLALCTLLVTASELFLKLGASQTANFSHWWAWTGISGLGSWWVWLAIACIIASFGSWLYVLRQLPITVAIPVGNVVHILVPLSCWLFLGEAISTRRWCGIALVLVGLLVVAEPFARMEERL